MTTEPTTAGERTGPYQQRVAEIWSSALGAPVTDGARNFFADGGDSFQAALVTAAVRREWGVQVTVQLLIDHPELTDYSEQLARFVDER